MKNELPYMERCVPVQDDTQMLLARLRSFCFPGGQELARRVRGIRTSEAGEIRMSPAARWIPFTAEQTIDATRSGFRWDARLHTGRISSIVITDAYEWGHGRLLVKTAVVVPLKKIVGPDIDRGELQRYLASIILCPPILLNHPSLQWTAIAPHILRVRDREQATPATVDLELSQDGCPLACRADRPRIAGKETLLTPWSGVGSEFHEYEGLRVPRRLEIAWQLPEGPFTYLREEVTSFTVLR
jgi:hypothetical protein